MKHSTPKIILAVVLLGLLSGLLFLQGEREAPQQTSATPNTGLRTQLLTVRGTQIQVEVAETQRQREIGLSHRKESLKEGEGMLFVFEKEGLYGFWMKDTHFPIDIIWITSEKRITHIEEGVRPESFPKVYISEEPAQFVLEIPAGYTQRNNIKVGDEVVLGEE